MSSMEVAARVGALLKARHQTVAVAESSAGGLIAARLLAVPGASAYFLGGAVVYTGPAREAFLEINRAGMQGMRAASEPYAVLLAERVKLQLGADWGLSETGAAGPAGNRYGDPAGHSCMAVAGLVPLRRTLSTGATDRADNMEAFAEAALLLMEEALR
jgi:PncC family amidohydrolase